MRFNSSEMVQFSMKKGDQEGRMTHKPPSRTIYDSAYKERWFKLKGNLLFFYRLTDHGVVEKNEPHGVFVLENITVEKDEADLKYLHGFTLTWKDDPYKRHSFYTLSENLLQSWITNLIRASYENLRAELLVLRLQIRQKSGKDPLKHLGTPLPVRSIRGVLVSPSKATNFLDLKHHLSSSNDLYLKTRADIDAKLYTEQTLRVKSAPSTPSFLPKQPLPPPRTNRDRRRINIDDSSTSEKSKINRASFKSHIKNSSTEVLDNGSFKSYVKDNITESI